MSGMLARRSRHGEGGPPMSYRQELRVFLAFLVQPLVAALFGFVTFPIVEFTDRQIRGGYSTDLTQAAIAFALGTGLVGFFVAPLAALPLFVWLRRRGPLTRAKTLVSGALLGNLPVVILLVLPQVGWPGTHGQPLSYGLVVSAIRALVFGAAIGVTCAGAFWWIAGRHLRLPRSIE
jgi:hypothetical protein